MTSDAPEPIDDPFDDDNDLCQKCGGAGWCEADDPINDDVDEWGYAECARCHGSGIDPACYRETGDE